MFEEFKEEGFVRPNKPLFLPNKEYSRGLSTFVIGCSDIILISAEYKERKIVLVKRKNDPMAGHWWTFGGRMQFGEYADQAAARCFNRETGLNLWPGQFVPLEKPYIFICKTRVQEPKNAGGHYIVLLHALTSLQAR